MCLGAGQRLNPMAARWHSLGSSFDLAHNGLHGSVGCSIGKGKKQAVTIK